MRARIDRLDIRAPEAGIVLERSVEPGQVVGQGGSPLFRIAKDGQVEMRALLAEQEISRLKVGLPAEVTPVGQDRSVAGSIWLLSPIVNPQTRQGERSEEHTSELQSLMRISYAVFCLKKKNNKTKNKKRTN